MSFERIAKKGKCNVCGKQTDVVVYASACGPVSYAYCESCLVEDLEPYEALVFCIASTGDWPDGINSVYQELVRKILPFHKKTEAEFAADVKRAQRNFTDAGF